MEALRPSGASAVGIDGTPFIKPRAMQREAPRLSTAMADRTALGEPVLAGRVGARRVHDRRDRRKLRGCELDRVPTLAGRSQAWASASMVRALLGSVALGILHASKQPVVVIRCAMGPDEASGECPVASVKVPLPVSRDAARVDRARAGPPDGASERRVEVLRSTRSSCSPRTSPRRVRSSARGDGRWPPRACWRVETVTSHSSRCARSVHSAGGATTIHRRPSTPRTRCRSEGPSGRWILRPSSGAHPVTLRQPRVTTRDADRRNGAAEARRFLMARPEGAIPATPALERRHEARDRRHPGGGCRRREGLLRGPRVEARRRPRGGDFRIVLPSPIPSGFGGSCR